MSEKLKAKVKELLKGGYALSQNGQKQLLNDLGAEGRDIIRAIAEGSVDVPHPKMRVNALLALGIHSSEKDQSIAAIKTVLNQTDPILKVHAMRTVARLDPGAFVDEIKAAFKEWSTRPEVALAAARAAAKIGGQKNVNALKRLRRRFLTLVPDKNSPSVKALDMLILEAKGDPPQGPVDDRKPIV